MMPRSWYSATIHPQGRALASPGNTENVPRPHCCFLVASNCTSAGKITCGCLFVAAKSPAAACSWQNQPRLPLILMPQRTLAAKFPAAWPCRVHTPHPEFPAAWAAANAGGVPLLVKLADDPASQLSAFPGPCPPVVRLPWTSLTASIETLVSPAASLLAAASLLFF